MYRKNKFIPCNATVFRVLFVFRPVGKFFENLKWILIIFFQNFQRILSTLIRKKVPKHSIPFNRNLLRHHQLLFFHSKSSVLHFLHWILRVNIQFVEFFICAEQKFHVARSSNVYNFLLYKRNLKRHRQFFNFLILRKKT